jgi:osmotically-inducible protein OsmY
MQNQQDACLAERIEHALRATGYGPLRGIEVTVDAQFVILGGRVSSYFLKQVAQETALSVAGTHRVRNNLEVGRPN